MTYRKIVVRLLSLLIVGLVCSIAYRASAVTRTIIFPVLGATSYSNDFGNPRVGHTHEGNDIFGKKMQPLLAAVDGTVRQVVYPEPSYGWYVRLEDAEGYTYSYVHINNDTPGTDNGTGGANLAYVPGVERSWPVVAGQVIAYMGDSGNAETTPPHLHFEIRTPDGEAVNPYFSLRAAKKLTRPTPTPQLPFELLPFGKFHVGSNVATGNVAVEISGDEVVVGAGLASPPQIRVMTSDGGQVSNFFLSQKTFRGGVDVAAGDVNGDGVDEIITGLGPGAEPLVQVVDRKGVVLSHFFAYTQRFKGGVRVSAADLDGDGVDEIITGASRGGGPDVRVYRMNGDLVTSFYAYSPRFRGGVDVAGVSATTTQAGLIVTAPAAGGSPDIRVYSPNGTYISSFYSGDSTFHGGMRVSTAVDQTTGVASIFTVPMSMGHGIVRQLSLGGAVMSERYAFERWWTGSFDVAVADGTVYTSSALNTRRGSLMKTNVTSMYSPFDYFW